MKVQSNEAIVTVAIVFFNAQDFLSQAIESVLYQTMHNLKLLLINDGSTDSSLEIAQKYQNDPRVTVYSDGQNRNLGYRLNQVPTIVHTKYLARMDADDYMHPDKIRKQIEVLETNPEIDVLGTNAYSIDENNLIQGIRLAYSDKEVLRKVNGFIHPTIIAKTEWFINNPYDVKAVRIEDAELWFRTSHRFNFQILPEPLLFYREFGENYYKKYFKGYGAILYALKKHHWNISFLKFVIKYFVSGMIYFLFNCIGKEYILVNKRNEVRLSPVSIEAVINNEN